MNPKQRRDYAISRIEFFLKEAKQIDDPLKLEGIFECVGELAGRAKKLFHEEHSPMQEISELKVI